MARASVTHSPMSSTSAAADPATRRPELEQLETVAQWLDRRYVDPILGLVLPGVGDVLGSVMGIYGVMVALKMRVHPVVIARMLVNLAIDSFIGSIPLLGAVGDFFFHAHSRNLALLKRRAPTGAARPVDWLIVGGAALLLIAALVLPILVLVGLVSLLLNQF